MKLELTGIRYSLASFTLAIDVTWTAPDCAIFGASGAGKTTLLELIAGLRRPAAGTILWDGTVLADPARGIFVPPEKRGLAYVPQEGALFPHLTVAENLRYGAGSRLDYRHVLEVLEIGSLEGRRPGSLSGGERQRVALGRALLAGPRLLLLDEPLAGVDLPLRARLLPYLVRVRAEFGLPFLLVTHSPDEVVALCREVVVLDRGTVVRRGPVAELFRESTTPRYEYRADEGR